MLLVRLFRRLTEENESVRRKSGKCDRLEFRNLVFPAEAVLTQSTFPTLRIGQSAFYQSIFLHAEQAARVELANWETGYSSSFRMAESKTNPSLTSFRLAKTNTHESWVRPMSCALRLQDP